MACRKLVCTIGKAYFKPKKCQTILVANHRLHRQTVNLRRIILKLFAIAVMTLPNRTILTGAGEEARQRTCHNTNAAAAVGNPLLLAIYAKYFAAYGISVAQSLCERQHFANREQFLQLKNTYEELWKNGIIPIANENDVVSDRELKFSDNDELATLIATGFGAETMLICTQSGGLLNREKQIVSEVNQIDDEILGLVDSSKSSLGTGGMASKLTFTKLATRMGIRVIIFGMNQPEGLLKALNGESGTTFLPQSANLSARNKWW
jgi:glutamate 5-kinase